MFEKKITFPCTLLNSHSYSLSFFLQKNRKKRSDFCFADKLLINRSFEFVINF